ncbi:MAG: hypothetical protein MRY32_03375 [Rickettsiales bacterium]|nr:hypothetical protein [Rickettsiales bacterium]
MKRINFFKNDLGSIALMGAAAITLLVVAAGVTIDAAKYVTVKSKFRNAVDAALLSSAAVAWEYENELDEVATRFFHANFPEQYMGSFNLSAVHVEHNAQEFSWTIRMDGDVNTTFGALVGFDSISMSHQARVEVDTSAHVDAVFTLDTSASMCTTTRRAQRDDTDEYAIEYVPDGECKKLEAAKEALTYIADHAFPSSATEAGPIFNMGVVPFNHKVRLPRQDSIPAPMRAVEARNPIEGDFGNNVTFTVNTAGANYYSNLSDANPLSEVISLTRMNSAAAKEDLKDKIDDIFQGPHGLGWTRSNIAAYTAALMLDPDYYRHFDGERPGEFLPENEKIVVMMTDGANIGCCWFSHPYGTFENQYLYLYEADLAHLTGLDKASGWARQWKTQYNIPEEGLCKKMKERGVIIYSIIFDVEDGDPGGQQIKEAYKDCASNDQFFFDVKSDEDLKNAYRTIASSFMPLRLSY